MNFKSVIILILIFSFVLVTFPKIEEVKAQGTIYIRADGSVEGTDKIQRDGNVYTFTYNIEPKIVVERDNIVIDGADFRIQGNGAEVGIDITYRNNVTIKNIQIIGAGIHLVGANNNTIFGNLIANNHHGIGFYGESNYNKIIGNTLMDNERGIYFSQSYNNSIYDNSFINNTRQVYDSVWEQPWYPQLLSVNFWDNCTTGNYWSNYNGTDTNGDGIGETPYVIDQNNQDNYPLMDKIEIPVIPPKENLSNDDQLLALFSTIAGFITSQSGILLLIITLVSAGLITFLVITAKRKRNSVEVTK
jgi:parallel beta-helix repeat protein